MPRRGRFTKAGPVTVRRSDGTTFTQPAYAPKAYWQVIKEQERESEAAELAQVTSNKAAAARVRLARKVSAGRAAVQQTVERRKSG